MKQIKMILTTLMILACTACLLVGCAAKESANTAVPTTTHPTTITPSTAPTNPTVPALLNVDWEMEGWLVLADGTVKDNIPITISGTIQNGEDKDILLLDIITPDDFRYSFGGPYGYLSFSRQEGHISYYYFGNYCYDSKYNEPRMCTFAIDAEKGFFLSFCDDGTGQYLVAATDPNVTAEEILEYFKKLDKEA